MFCGFCALSRLNRVGMAAKRRKRRRRGWGSIRRRVRWWRGDPGLEMKWLECSPHDLRVLCLIAAEPGWNGREEAQEAQEGVEFDAEEGSVVEERSGFGDEVA